MLTMGLHFGHDANISIFDGATCLAFYEKERHCRVRHAIGLTGSEILGLLHSLGLKIEDIDVCAITVTQYGSVIDWEGNLEISLSGQIKISANKIEDVDTAYYRQPDIYHRWMLWSQYPPKSAFGLSPIFPVGDVLDGFPITLEAIAKQAPALDYRNGHIQDINFSIEGRSPKKSVYMCHHLANSSYSYAASPFERALIISIDGTTAENFSGGGIYYGSSGQSFPLIPHGFWGGGFYGHLSQVLGFGDAGGEGKLMGLAAYGLPVYADRHLVGSSADLGGLHGHEMALRWLESTVQVDSQSLPAWDGWSDPPQIYADIAASAQWIFQENVLATVDAAVALARRNNLPFDGICLSGGCALNCPANSLVAAKYSNVFVPPAVNDEGLSLGSALAVSGLSQRPAAVTPALAYLGGAYPDETAAAVRDHAADLVPLASGEAALTLLAEALCEGKVAGFHYGKSEVGPRALGHRSILASPHIAANNRRVNRVKNREPWRPFAPIVTERSLDLFSHVAKGSYFMLFNARVKGKEMPAITHADGTARVQVATPESGDVFRLLEAVGRISGHEVLLNTSFNDRGEPIVERPADAVRSFLKMDLDLLYLDGTLYAKAGPGA